MFKWLRDKFTPSSEQPGVKYIFRASEAARGVTVRQRVLLEAAEPKLGFRFVPSVIGTFELSFLWGFFDEYLGMEPPPAGMFQDNRHTQIFFAIVAYHQEVYGTSFDEAVKEAQEVVRVKNADEPVFRYVVERGRHSYSNPSGPYYIEIANKFHQSKMLPKECYQSH